VCLAAGAFAAAAASLAIEGGTASFQVSTTVPGISVKGKSTALEAHSTFQRAVDGLHLENIRASLPVKSIATGMSLRDEHMRRYIFTTSEGQTPDLRFDAAGAACTPQSERGAEYSCKVTGDLTIRGTARPFSIPIKVRADGSAYRASGEGVVKLSDYGIEQPSQFGVKTANEIQLHLEFNGRSVEEVAAGGRQ
jgi:polyisoprenoid-binding protein YceI